MARFLSFAFLLWLPGCAGPLPAPPRPGELQVADADTLFCDLEADGSLIMEQVAERPGAARRPDCILFNEGGHTIRVWSEAQATGMTRLIFRARAVDGGPTSPRFLGPWSRTVLEDLRP